MMSEMGIFRQLSGGTFLAQCGNGGDGAKNEETVQNRIHNESEEHYTPIPIQSIEENA
jgi:hypothetical protein